ncbi:peptidylprolyl isomerase [Flaviaesturariibacter aridisoli]|uniref:Peptidylprolyl isomerase n=1 Tax=Flaviaesturariibacter aridisoli TaxID=2545761 RepID=A0A4R4DZF6_9BACT|nr:peptidylprolyl isomerase [Flaviaesturariibacter aridisoli]TCZ69643.1 peptidylprolyl isomerase [Flaviaesturariibacter aridisoli]
MKKAFLFLLSTVLAAGAFAQPKKQVADRVIAVVGDRIVLESDVKNALADALRQGQQLPENAECAIMEQALVSKILVLQAERDSLKVDESDVESELDQRIRYFVRQYGSQDELERIAGKTIYQIKDDAREAVRETKLAQQMQRKIVDNVRITPTEVNAYFNRIPADSLPLFESELEIGQIVIYPKPSKDLEAYVMSEMNNFKRQIESKQITFEEVVRQKSEDPGSKDRGGQYQINRTDKSWDPAFVAAAFRLKEGEISNVVRSKFGFHLIQLLQRNGDDALVRHILMKAPVTNEEINSATRKLDSVRSRLVAGTIDFATAAGRYSDDETSKFTGPFIQGRNGNFVTIDELEKDIVPQLARMRVGDLSQPFAFTNERGDKGVRIIYLKTRTEPHRMNLKDDFNRISTAALEEKKMQTLDKWLNSHIADHYIMLDPDLNHCGQLQRWTAGAHTAAR